MAVMGWLKSILVGRDDDKPTVSDEDGPPTTAEMQAALDRLDAMVKPAIFGEIGGGRPDKDDRATSWWGGNFLGAAGEDVPVCAKSGRIMTPVLQVRVDELSETIPALDGVALLTFWLDFEDAPLGDVENGSGFALRTYPSLDGLVPLGPGYREHPTMPTFPLFWREILPEQPAWDDIAFEVPTRVARASESDWFFESRYAVATSKLYPQRPVKIGGWPHWIQGDQWPKDALFAFQIDSTDKGNIMIGDSGSFYVFRTPRGWEIRSDFF